MPAGRVARIVDGRSFVLDDGREIRLAALEVPAESGARRRTMRGLRSRRLLAGHMVALRQGESAPDRYGRIVAHAYVTDADRHAARPTARPPTCCSPRATLEWGQIQAVSRLRRRAFVT